MYVSKGLIAFYAESSTMDESHALYGARFNDPDDLAKLDAYARKVAGAMLALAPAGNVYARLYCTKSTNLVGETIVWLRFRGHRGSWERVWRALGGYGGKAGVMKPETITKALAAVGA